MATYDEKLIAKHINILGITREEAIALIEEDKRIDRMTMKEVTADLTDEQKKTVKKATQADRKPTVYQFQKRERKANDDKRFLIDLFNSAIVNSDDKGFGELPQVEITNQEREIVFQYNGKKYKLTLSAPRS